MFYYGLLVSLGLYFFTACLLVSVIVIIRADTTFLRSVVLLVFISISRDTWRYSRIFMNYAFLLVFFMLYLFLQQLLIEIMLLNRVC